MENKLPLSSDKPTVFVINREVIFMPIYIVRKHNEGTVIQTNRNNSATSGNTWEHAIKCFIRIILLSNAALEEQLIILSSNYIPASNNTQLLIRMYISKLEL